MQIQLQQDDNLGRYTINAYEPGCLRVNEKTYDRSVIVGRDRLVEDWPPQDFVALNEAHLRQVLRLNAEVVLLGTGSAVEFLSPELTHLFLAQKIGIEVMDTRAACRTYNVLMSEGRNAVAALLIR